MAAKTMKPKRPMLDELAVLDEQVSAAHHRARELAQTIAQHAQSIEQLRAARIAAYADGVESAAAAAKTKAATAEAHAVELEERRLGADVAARRAQRERDAFVAANHARLVSERAPIAHAAVKLIEDAIGALAAGVEAWQSEAALQVHLLRSVAGRDGREVPDLPVQQLVRDLRRAAADGVPAPLPRPAPSHTVLDDGDKHPDGSAGVVFEGIG